MSTYRLAAFDLDGTLVDTAPDLARCLGRALESTGFEPPSQNEARGWIGDGVEMLLRRAMAAQSHRPPDAERWGEALATFKRCYAAHLFDESRIYPGVIETLKILASRGLTLGCATNKPDGFATPLLQQAGIAPLLDFVHAGDTFGTRKPAPEPLTRAAERFAINPSHAVMIGDSRNDLEAAHAADFDFVFARYGYARGDDPALLAQRAAVNTFSALPELLCGQ